MILAPPKREIWTPRCPKCGRIRRAPMRTPYRPRMLNARGQVLRFGSGPDKGKVVRLASGKAKQESDTNSDCSCCTVVPGCTYCDPAPQSVSFAFSSVVLYPVCFNGNSATGVSINVSGDLERDLDDGGGGIFCVFDGVFPAEGRVETFENTDCTGDVIGAIDINEAFVSIVRTSTGWRVEMMIDGTPDPILGSAHGFFGIPFHSEPTTTCIDFTATNEFISASDGYGDGSFAATLNF